MRNVSHLPLTTMFGCSKLFLALLVLASAVIGATTPAMSDVNVKILTKKWNNDGVIFDELGRYSNWNKRYYLVVQGGKLDQVVFYNRDENYLRVVRIDANGGYKVLATHTISGKFDEIVRGEFGGMNIKDLLFFNRKSGKVVVYEINSLGKLKKLHDTVLPPPSTHGKWDIIAAGRVEFGKIYNLLVYNKTEGKARFYRSKKTFQKIGAVSVPSYSFSPARNYANWRKNWDQIVPANVDGDKYTDFLFYNQDGGGTEKGSATYGHAKFISFGPIFKFKTISETTTEWPVGSHVIIVPGQYGGDKTTDFVVYQASAGQGQIWTNNGKGMYKRSGTKKWQRRWTHIVPVRTLDADFHASDHLLFFTTQKVLNVVPVYLNGASISAKNFNTWIEFANQAFAPAGIFFKLKDNKRKWEYPAIDVKKSEDRTEEENAEISACTGLADTKILTEKAKSYREHGKANDLIVFVKSGDGSSTGCSSPGSLYTVMPQYDNTPTALRWRAIDTMSPPRVSYNPKLFVHEIGHHFGLAHTNPDNPTTPKENPYGYDIDGDPGGTWTAVWDTSPNPSAKADSSGKFPPEWAPLTNWCDDSGNNNLTINTTETYTLNPERHNIMSRGINCDGLYRMSPGQVRAVRESLWHSRNYYLE